MPCDPINCDLVRDVTFVPDLKGPALLVRWRGVPMGFIRPFNRIPKLKASVSAECRKAVRDEYKKHLGKWVASLIGGGYFDTKEEAARHVVARTLEEASGMPLIEAALREDYEEVNRLLREIRSQVIVEERDA